ncbi:RNase adapter RapZ, partial [Staphylococcus aureus]|uniref:RNase adapter RapZ n=1 Tax=Staphylococcus aureus TaxID=1280 RepID=UPI0037DA396F
MQSLQHIPYFSLHNLPPLLLPKFLHFIQQPNPSLTKLPIPIHLTPNQLFNSLLPVVHKLKSQSHVIIHVIFLQATT